MITVKTNNNSLLFKLKPLVTGARVIGESCEETVTDSEGNQHKAVIINYAKIKHG